MSILSEILDENIVDLKMDVNNKDEAINHLSKLLEKAGYIGDIDMFLKDIYYRESQGITGIGNEIAIPHGKSDSVKKIGIAIGKTTKKIDWETLDNDGVRIIFLFAVSNDNTYANNHLKLLSSLAGKLGNDDIVEKLRSVETYSDLLRIF